MRFFIILLLFCCVQLQSQHTFSIVAIDAESGDIGSAGATCLFFENAARDISDIVLGAGAIHTQAWYNTGNQNNARTRMEAGDSPEEIINWLVANDSGAGSSSDRQYGIVDIKDGVTRSAAHTGATNFNVKGQRTGQDYAIQGNILISEDVLDNMENAYLNTEGPLCDRLMAVLQAAKIPGADERCLDEGISSGSAFLRVAKPTDTNSDYGNLWLELNETITNNNFSIDPIDMIQEKFNTFKINSTYESEYSLTVSPNPTSHSIKFNNDKQQFTSVEILSSDGTKIESIPLSIDSREVSLSHLADGLYLLKFNDKSSKFYMSRCLKITR